LYNIYFYFLEKVYNHEFFSKMNWDALYKKLIIPPFIPSVENNEDPIHFDQEFKDLPIKTFSDTESL